MLTVNYYDAKGVVIVRTRTYSTKRLARDAIARAEKRRQICGYAGKRTAHDSPTCHH
jgi:hypothetical protein